MDISDCNIFIATVPTPIDKKNNPDFRPLLDVCKKISKLLKKETSLFLKVQFTQVLLKKYVQRNLRKMKNY